MLIFAVVQLLVLNAVPLFTSRQTNSRQQPDFGGQKYTKSKFSSGSTPNPLGELTVLPCP